MNATTQQDDETTLWRAALAKAGLTNDDVRDVSVCRADDGTIREWPIMLQNGRRYRLTLSGELVTY